MKQPNEDRDVTITITVMQKDRKLHISASVPDHAEGTVAMLVTDLMMQTANARMNEVTGDDQPVQTVTRQ